MFQVGTTVTSLTQSESIISEKTSCYFTKLKFLHNKYLTVNKTKNFWFRSPTQLFTLKVKNRKFCSLLNKEKWLMRFLAKNNLNEFRILLMQLTSSSYNMYNWVSRMLAVAQLAERLLAIIIEAVVYRLIYWKYDNEMDLAIF